MNDHVTAQEAQLPQVYEAAKQALVTCEQIDECKGWADKSAALASYAKQAEDETLMNHARRIQLRAVRRMGELIEAVEPGHGANQNIQEGGHPKVTRRDFAEDAGISEHQQKTAQRVARVPEDDFESQVESDSPPTVTAVAEQGKKPHVANNSGNNEWYTSDQYLSAARRKVMKRTTGPYLSLATPTHYVRFPWSGLGFPR